MIKKIVLIAQKENTNDLCIYVCVCKLVVEVLYNNFKKIVQLVDTYIRIRTCIYMCFDL